MPGNQTNKYVTPVGLQQPAAADLSDGTTGSGAVVLAGSPALTGVPTAPTAAVSTNTTQIATTAFVQTAAGSAGADTLNVNGSIVVTPFSFTALVNGIGPIGQTKVNSFPLANNKPCMVEIPGNFQGSSARVIGTVYQNTTNYPLLVVVSGFSVSAGNITMTAFSDTSTNPSTQIAISISYNASGARADFNFFVLPGNYYKVTASSGTFTVTGGIWREYMCQNGTFTDSGDIVSSPGRSLSTVYQNNTASTMFVVAQLTGVSSGGLVQSISDISTLPTSVIEQLEQTSSGAGPVTCFFIVPSGHYYKVTAASGSISHWHEYSWNIPCTKSADLSLTTGVGQTRSANAVSLTASSGGSNVTTLTPQMWRNNLFRVRWVNVVLSNSLNGVVTCQAVTDDGIPPYKYICFTNESGANIPRTMRFPVMPADIYYVAEVTGSNGTLSTVHWWEYQLG